MSKVIYLEKTDIFSTLTTFVYCFMWQLYAAEQQGISGYINCPNGLSPGRWLQPYIDNEMFSKEPNAWNWYFEQPKIDSPPPRSESDIWTWETDGDKMEGHSLMSQPLSVIKDFYKKHLHFNHETNRRGQLIVDKYGIDFGRTIGISWRGTDIYLDGRPRLSIATYFPFIDDLLETYPDLRIMSSAEEETILDPLLARYPNSFKIEEFVSSPFQSKHNPERISNMSGYEKGLQPALMVWLFSKCAHYIKNRSSTGAVASWLSSGRIVNLAHEETLSYLKMDDQAEIEGIKYPLYR
jgi:hypothetical protein